MTAFNRFLFLIVFSFLVFVVSREAIADCSNPTGTEGQMTYNTTYKTAQFCDGTDWWSMKGGAGGNVASFDNCQDGETPVYVAANNRFECPPDPPFSCASDAVGSSACDDVNGIVEYWAPGNYTFNVPAVTTSITVHALGAGGTSSGSAQNNKAGGGGGYARKTISVSPGDTFSLIVGAHSTTSCSAGGDSSVGAWITAGGGGCPAGGTGTGGDVNGTGGAGGVSPGVYTNGPPGSAGTNGGAGGGGAGGANTGNNGGAGGAGSLYGGGGGYGGGVTSGGGANGTTGAAGSDSYAGGAGPAAGVIVSPGGGGYGSGQPGGSFGGGGGGGGVMSGGDGYVRIQWTVP